jgi:hypothetical protein
MPHYSEAAVERGAPSLRCCFCKLPIKPSLATRFVPYARTLL